MSRPPKPTRPAWATEAVLRCRSLASMSEQQIQALERQYGVPIQRPGSRPAIAPTIFEYEKRVRAPTFDPRHPCQALLFDAP